MLRAALRSPIVGLDIGSTTLRAVVLRRRRSGWALAAAREATLPDPLPEEGRDTSPAVSDAVADLFATMGLRRARVASAIAGHVVIVRRLTIAVDGPADIGSVVAWEAEQYVPFDPADVRLDYDVLGPRSPAGTIDVLFVAARNDHVDARVAALVGSGHRPAVVDVEGFALANAHQLNYPDQADGLSVLVHAGRRLLVVCLVEAGMPVFARDISAGTQLHLDGLQRELGSRGIDELAARQLLDGTTTAGVDPQEIAYVLREASVQLAHEVGKTVAFHRGLATTGQVRRVVLSGGGCQVTGLAEALMRELDAPVELFDPFRRIRHAVPRVPPPAVRPAYAVAVGLALREEARR